MTLKPYRILNETELQTLTRVCDARVAHWNDQYARFPLTFTLERAARQPDTSTDLIAFTEHGQTLAFTPQDLSCIQYALFGDQSACFQTTATTLFCRFIQSLLLTPFTAENVTDHGRIAEIDMSKQTCIDQKMWFYKGSPCLALTLSQGKQSITIYLHPQWVLRTLHKPTASAQDLTACADALAKTILPCHVELNPLVLPLHALMQLKPGDVIQTDHPLSTPLRLQHQHQPLCKVDIGQYHAHKSIQVTTTDAPQSPSAIKEST